MSEAPLWQDSGVTLLRNRQTGAVIELVHDSEGWFQVSSLPFLIYFY